jgi:hypothetical protein
MRASYILNEPEWETRVVAETVGHLGQGEKVLKEIVRSMKN